MSVYTWEIDKLPLSSDSASDGANIASIIATLNQREVDDWDLMQISKIGSQIVFFWRSKK